MTALQLAGGIFLGFGALEVFKVLVAVGYENHKRNAMKRDLVEVADDFIDKMHNDLMAERAKEEAAKRKPAPRRKPAPKKAPAKKTSANIAKPRKPVAKKGGKK